MHVNYNLELLLMKYFETFRIKGNVTFFTKAFCRFVAAITPSLIALNNHVTVAIITHLGAYVI